MLSTSRFMEYLRTRDFGPYIGVPCSFLRPFINYVIDHYASEYIAVNNEGEGIALACGAYLAGRRPVVMFQNSGLGNTVNPLTSLAYIFKIPLLLITTWRGQPGLNDEPQHQLMGRITSAMLEMMEIKSSLFPEHDQEMEPKMEAALEYMDTAKLPYAFVMRKDVVTEYALRAPDPVPGKVRARGRDLASEVQAGSLLFRREAIVTIADAVVPEVLMLATTGKTARELAEYRDRPENFYVVGSMGCASSIALGIALQKPERQVLVLDGDGAALMRLEAMVSVGHYHPANLIHVILDNESYESTGGQHTLAGSVCFAQIALACGYRTAVSACTAGRLAQLVQLASTTGGPHLIHFRIQPGSDPNLTRPALSPTQVALRFRQSIGSKRPNVSLTSRFCDECHNRSLS